MKNFDRWIKSELDPYEASRPDAAWDQFASRLDQAESQDAENAQFDQALKNKLEQVEAPYEPSHWQHFLQTLERQARQRADMLRLKVVEAALFMLILLTLWNLNAPDYRPDTSHLPMASLSESQPGPVEGPAPSPEGMASAQTTEGLSVLPPNHGSSSVSEPTFTPVSPVQTVTSTLRLAVHQPVQEMVNSRNPSIVSPGPAFPSIPDHPVEQPVPLLDNVHPQLDPLPVLVTSLPVSTRSNIRHRLSMAINGDMNYVMTPYDQLLVKKGYDQLVSGYGASLGYSLEGPQWGLRSTVTYHRKYYLPKPYTEVFDGDIQRGYFSETLRDIELNMISLSVLGQRTFSRVNRWHTYGLIGGSAHLAFQANYDRKQSYTPGADPNPSGVTPEPLTESKTSQKRYADGLFEGGNLAENSYLTIDVGVGLEWHLAGRTSLFMEPIYQHNPFQKSLGPNKDRINTLSISLGARVSL